ncbi:MAG: crossover junction endodeoxyribonuclease RuvC [Chloroflexi bacterium GWB2_49_20]|nr:MAG: crossover junction endodeoxyribonuclease RuvC [Chloroflexi bacterium GWB2_49_20]OGN76723.1 MAG: crossover junction endodeoxyribonuclease RuvC [Chloroflexi bacterium GWC2_49_37]OGN83683.1 MAG: crossover junction endodeoxyribonuclease RuvC [Chloroflexi bacterium GWD2_49_16]HBG74195.1 crossover junction endodeoxyribonuclease RuvC [Anaerolineae bacterium]HCC78988.1 crossover junction endodeoxyribonuclease RuvC [Anaerolineae bacterium]
MTLILGLDPGTATTGYGLVSEAPDGDLQAIEYGTIQTPAGMSDPERLVILYQRLREIILLHRPQGSAVEKLFFQKNVRTAIAVSQARGVILVALAEAGLTIGEYTPNEIKQAVTGFGSADKHQVQEMVRILLNLRGIPKPDDAADALAVAITHLHTNHY